MANLTLAQLFMYVDGSKKAESQNVSSIAEAKRVLAARKEGQE